MLHGKTVSGNHLELFLKNPKEFYWRHVNRDKTWIYHYSRDIKLHSKQDCAGWPSSKKGEVNFVSITILWRLISVEAKGIIFNDYFKKGKCITGGYYASLLLNLSEEVNKKRHHLGKKTLVSPRKCSSTSISHWYKNNLRIKVRIV